MNIQEFDTEDTRDIDTSDNADALGNVPDSIIEQALRPIVDASTSVAVPAQHADVTSHNPVNDAGQPMNNATTSTGQQAEPEDPPRRPVFRARPLIEDIVTPDNIRGRRPLPELADLPANPRMTGPRRQRKKTHMPSR